MTPATRVALVGATASGKSRAAHGAALECGHAEIVAVDAMTAYRGMDIGTAKPTRTDRAEVRYHLVDVLDPSEEMTVRRFQELCAAALDEIAGRGNTAVLVGGTGLYHRAVIDGLEIPPSFPEIRADLEAQAGSPAGAARLHADLMALDPVAASRIDVANTRRVVRALEVVRATGRPFSSYGAGLEQYPASPVAQIGITFDAAAVDAAIAGRFTAWMRAGLLDEVRGLLDARGGLSRTARQAVGYRQLIAHIEDAVPLEDAVAAAIAATRRLARRQWRWFRRDPRITWVPDAPTAALALSERL